MRLRTREAGGGALRRDVERGREPSGGAGGASGRPRAPAAGAGALAARRPLLRSALYSAPLGALGRLSCCPMLSASPPTFLASCASCIRASLAPTVSVRTLSLRRLAATRPRIPKPRRRTQSRIPHLMKFESSRFVIVRSTAATKHNPNSTHPPTHTHHSTQGKSQYAEEGAHTFLLSPSRRFNTRSRQ
jgi:hypothetical protein